MRVDEAPMRTAADVRDPRKDPKCMDQIQRHFGDFAEKRVVMSYYGVGKGVVHFVRVINGKKKERRITLPGWRKWAEGSEVLHVAK